MGKIKIYIMFVLILLGISVSGILLGTGIEKVYMNHPEYFSSNFIMALVIFCFGELVSVFLHEVTHVIAYKLQGVDIRMLYVFPFCIVKENNQIRVFVLFNLQIGFGGIVIPQLPVFANDKDYNDFRNKMRASLISAPIFSALLGVVSLLLLCTTINYINIDIRSYYFIFFATTIFWSFYINITSFLNLGTIVGDYIGAKKMKIDVLYSLLQIYNYFLLQENILKEKVRNENKYLINLIKEEVKNLTFNLEDSTINFLLADALIYEMILDGGEYTISFIDNINKIVKNVKGRLKYESYSCFFTHTILYLCINNKRDEAIELWEKYYSEMPGTKVGCYRSKQVDLFLYGKKKNDIQSKEGIDISTMDSLFSKLSNYYDDEVLINKKIDKGKI